MLSYRYANLVYANTPTSKYTFPVASDDTRLSNSSIWKPLATHLSQHLHSFILPHLLPVEDGSLFASL